MTTSIMIDCDKLFEGFVKKLEQSIRGALGGPIESSIDVNPFIKDALEDLVTEQVNLVLEVRKEVILNRIEETMTVEAISTIVDGMISKVVKEAIEKVVRRKLILTLSTMSEDDC